MMLNGNDELRVGHLAALSDTHKGFRKSLNQRGQLPAAEVFVVIKTFGKKGVDKNKQDSGVGGQT